MPKSLSGDPVIGWKIGLTSRAMQQALNIDIPDSGVLTRSMRFETGATVPANRFIQPRIEAEIAFVMKSDLGGTHVTRDDVLAATDYVSPSLEILDTRILRRDPESGATRKVFDTIADNAANAGVVLGKEQHTPDNLRWVGAIVHVNGTVEETGLGAGVLNDPVESVVWLAKRMAEYNTIIKAGQVILSGSFIRLSSVHPDPNRRGFRRLWIRRPGLCLKRAHAQEPCAAVQGRRVIIQQIGGYARHTPVERILCLQRFQCQGARITVQKCARQTAVEVNATLGQVEIGRFAHERPKRARSHRQCLAPACRGFDISGSQPWPVRALCNLAKPLPASKSSTVSNSSASPTASATIASTEWGSRA